MKFILFLVVVFACSLSVYSQNTVEDAKNLKDLPVYFVDSVVVQKAIIDRINPADIANIFVVKGEKALKVKGNTEHKKSVVFIETKDFVRKKYWKLFSSKSTEYGKIVPAAGDDKFIQYIIDGHPVKSDVLLSEINNRNLVKVNVISRDSLLKKYGVYRMNYGVEIYTSVQDSLLKK